MPSFADRKAKEKKYMRNLASPSVIKSILAEKGFRFSKSLGQNFLTDENVLDAIVEGSGIDKSTFVLEIGPGFGTLTQRLCAAAGKVVAVEIDNQAADILEENLCECDNLRIVRGDILKIDLKKLIDEEFGASSRVRVVANLPYYITTPILMLLIERGYPIDSVTVMIQKEVADRLLASPGGKDYGAITLSVQYRCDCESIVTVPPEAFMPPPKVTSSVIRLDLRKEARVKVKDEKMFFKVIKAAFAQRRKTLLNALSNSNAFSMNKEEIKVMLNDMSLDERCRGETLSIEQYARISEKIR